MQRKNEQTAYRIQVPQCTPTECLTPRSRWILHAPAREGEQSPVSYQPCGNVCLPEQDGSVPSGHTCWLLRCHFGQYAPIGIAASVMLPNTRPIDWKSSAE